MGKVKEKPRYNVISLRVTDDEKARIEKLIKRSGKGPGNFLRDRIFKREAKV